VRTEVDREAAGFRVPQPVRLPVGKTDQLGVAVLVTETFGFLIFTSARPPK
jgi:hypothetical protein